ncbi:MAG: hypothetical protein COV59_05700 [Candidatus Magasanikbacteria bacterium CG11_big_fil_rev_8_21_14_0_20_39_34]|uniref:DUF4012 domain-containing protein n=1 Tax=Candidatus Magasanikbacteria bacterium CG11_big_fil_rev_8_21_14_0_20_39_34 TaxID=1974653 RepID=A0A2H0N431_9BACT|nr:MAG: hypothetical protein COV59_05700 [Candidatus Magasanikbacteria bacterium CG11_big_fil_rev_8_21_14_0_20_39_34]
MFLRKRKKNIFWILMLCMVLALIGGIYFLFYRISHFFEPNNLFQNSFVQQKIVSYVGGDKKDFVGILPEILGFSEPKYYLVLFENNTELRPGGGFIGSYAVLKVDGGKLDIIKVEGTEVLDNAAPSTWRPEPPSFLQAPLGIDRWYFRDSNWSPDFPTDAENAKMLFQGENGEMGDKINGVIAFTPTVLERLLGILGPVTIENIEFTKENVVERLEREVEYDYKEKGIKFQNRKDILKPFMEALIAKGQESFWGHVSEYISLMEELFDQKHIMAYFEDDAVQKVLLAHNYAGAVKVPKGDMLLYVDANLSALKTDYALERKIEYSIEPDENGYVAKVTMHYDHNGKFDWRTTRYRTFARIFVPKRSTLLSVEGQLPWDNVRKLGETFSGEELGLTWFGAYTSVEPGQEGMLTFHYRVSDAVAKMIQAGAYTLSVPKQLGTLSHGLTLDLNFGKNIVSASPGEAQENWGDDTYTIHSDLLVDREFNVFFE